MVSQSLYQLLSRKAIPEGIYILKSTCYVGLVNEGEQLLVGSTLEIAVGLAQVNIDESPALDRRHLGDL